MVSLSTLVLFSGVVVVLVLTPGPTMAYLVSRSICQGRSAAILSTLGVAVGAVVHMICAAVGLSAMLLAVPLAYELLKWLGVLYLLWLAWQAVRPGKRGPFMIKDLPPDSARKLFAMGFLTNVLNPKLAAFYLAIFPQFANPESGSILSQNLILGATHILISFTVNLLVAMSAATIAHWLSRRPSWLAAQRYVMGFVLASLAIRLAIEQRRGA